MLESCHDTLLRHLICDYLMAKALALLPDGQPQDSDVKRKCQILWNWSAPGPHRFSIMLEPTWLNGGTVPLEDKEMARGYDGENNTIVLRDSSLNSTDIEAAVAHTIAEFFHALDWTIFYNIHGIDNEQWHKYAPVKFHKP